MRGLPATTFWSLLTMYLALAHHGCGHIKAARRLREEATVAFDFASQSHANQKIGDWFSWTERMAVEQLRHELEALLIPDKK
jgi:hypothetical protein